MEKKYLLLTSAHFTHRQSETLPKKKYFNQRPKVFTENMKSFYIRKIIYFLCLFCCMEPNVTKQHTANIVKNGPRIFNILRCGKLCQSPYLINIPTGCGSLNFTPPLKFIPSKMPQNAL